MRILVVDTDNNLADAIAGELKEALVQYASDGESGLRIALEKQFHLIVIDSESPNKNGLTISMELREQKVSTPILLLVTNYSVSEIVHLLDSGANDCVVKSSKIHVIVARMKALMRRSQWNLCAEVRHDHIDGGILRNGQGGA